MKEKFIGVGLGVGAALTLGIVWTDSAQAFSLGSSVTVTNLIKDVDTPAETLFDVSDPKVVGEGLELTQFGGIWNIDFTENSVLFSINSRFGNVVSGDDVYRLKALNFGKPGQKSLTSLKFASTGRVPFLEPPQANPLTGDSFEVIFPLGFAQNLTTIPVGELAFRIDLTIVELPPTPVPTPALLPGLVGMGLAAWRRHRIGDQND
jgi:hypothetical protein